MALQSQLIDVPFATGLQQKTDARLLQSGAQLGMNNAVIDKLGAVCKRPGTSGVPGDVFSAWGNSIYATHSGQRVFRNVGGGVGLMSSGRVWAYSPTHAKWTDVDSISPLVGSVQGVAAPVTSCTSYDIAYGDGYAAIVYAANEVGYLVLQDVATGAIVFGPSPVSTTLGVTVRFARVLIQGGSAIVVYQDTSTVANVRARALDLTTWAWGADTLLQSDHASSQAVFDVHATLGSSTHWVLLYAQTDAAGKCRMGIVTYTGLTATAIYSYQPPAGYGTGYALQAVTVHSTAGERIWIAYSTLNNAFTTSSQRCFDVNFYTLVPITMDFELWNESGSSSVRLGIERLSSTQCIVVGALKTHKDGYYAVAATATGPAGVARFVPGWQPACKPFTTGGRVLCCMMDATLQPGAASSYVVMDLDPLSSIRYAAARPVVTLSPRIVDPAAGDMYLLPSAAFVTASETLLIGSSLRSGVGSVGVDVMPVGTSYSTHQTAALGSAVYIAAGVPSSHSGGKVSEIGFLEQPASIVGFPSTGAGTMAVGTYQYLAVYEWTDGATGQRVQSAPAFSADVVLGVGNNTVTLTTPCLHLTTKTDMEKTSDVGIAIYRTTPSVSVGVYRRLATGAASMNNLLTASVTFVDLVPDSAIVSAEPYNTAQLPNGCPPCFTSLVSHGGRLVGASGTDIWFSKQSDGGSSQPQFSDVLVVSCQDGGPITALASQDGQLIIFKRNSIYVIAGDGPDANGSGNSWSDPRRVPSDVGCTSDWRSVVATPNGVIFQSEKKLHILTRSQEVQYLSGPVEDELAANPVVTFAMLHSRRDEARFGVRYSETAGPGNGYVLNWNYVTQTWSRLDYYDIGSVVQGSSFESAADIDGVCWYASGGGVQHENTDLTTAGAYLDGAEWVYMSVQAAYSKPAGVMGFVRFWQALLAFRQTDPCGVTIAASYDYGTAFPDVRTFSDAEIAAFSTPRAQVSLSLTRQKAESVSVVIEDAPPTTLASTTGGGISLFGLSFLVGAKSGPRRLPAHQGK